MKKTPTEEEIFKKYLNHISTPDLFATAIIKYYDNFDIARPKKEDLRKIMFETVNINQFENEKKLQVEERIEMLLSYYFDE